MSLSIGIVGLPNVGKSTLFNALTKAQNAQVGNYPFCTIEPNKATVAVPDSRVDALTNKVKPAKTIYASVEFLDIAGLVRGASRGEGLGNQFLAAVRECAAIVHVVRCFEDDNITHVDGSVNPVRDLETIETELILADLQTVERRIEKTARLAKGNKDLLATLDDLKHLQDHLNAGKVASSFPSEVDYGLLSAKPLIYCANVDESAVAQGNALSAEVCQYAQQRQSACITLCARMEEELQGLSPEEQQEYLLASGANCSGLEQILRTGYDTLGLCSFFTAGSDEVRAWTIHKGWKAPQAAGVIHTDFERGFIRAEVIAFADYMSHANEAACRADAVLRVEGKDYVVQDGDVMHFLFSQSSAKKKT